MGDSLLNVFFGTLDTLAIFALIFKTFRWPYWKEFNKIFVVSVVMGIVSYTDRSVLGLEAYDPAIQFILYILAIKFVFKATCYYAFPLASIGYVSYLTIQFIIYPTLLALGIVSTSDAEAVGGLGTYIIQASSELGAFAVAYILYIFGLGFSYVDIPPHDAYVVERKTLMDTVANALATIAVTTIMYWIMNFSIHIFIILPMLLVTLTFLLYISLRKDVGQ